MEIETELEITFNELVQWMIDELRLKDKRKEDIIYASRISEDRDLKSSIKETARIIRKIEDASSGNLMNIKDIRRRLEELHSITLLASAYPEKMAKRAKGLRAGQVFKKGNIYQILDKNGCTEADNQEDLLLTDN